MTIPPELEAQILRYYHVERWRPNTIARQLRVHHATVARVLARAGLPRIGRPRPSRVDPYLPFILATLEVCRPQYRCMMDAEDLADRPGKRSPLPRRLSAPTMTMLAATSNPWRCCIARKAGTPRPNSS